MEKLRLRESKGLDLSHIANKLQNHDWKLGPFPLKPVPFGPQKGDTVFIHSLFYSFGQQHFLSVYYVPVSIIILGIQWLLPSYSLQQFMAQETSLELQKSNKRPSKRELLASVMFHGRQSP